ncbi:Oidioi.mRNA.OKI2018_I69.chr1.g2484.t1.cds [Oikopleura dioica]|uniref:Oidioi.mRNA.OKI2018_I69.chr1.g2484.t1.cds n=1 Tax=Oikopleura dioica TaxID=34765 RepID=A0ABN7SWG2_OIKDI|nr:Oidioi.mRNA.OKI2018_I69.chr1.g2484.t1.cds [Oikopleura dioica]
MHLTLPEIRNLRPDANGERDLKMALGELQKLMLEKETAEAWVPELTYWAIMTVKSIGIELVKVDKFPINNIQTTRRFGQSDVAVFSSLSCMIVTGIHYSIDRGDSSLIDYIIKQAHDIKPVLDWILASIAISKPEFILSMLLKNAFETFRRASDENEAQLHALTVILEYLSEIKPDIVTDCLLKPLTPHNEHVFMWTVYLIHILKSSIKKEKVELVRRITKQAAKYITPGLLQEMHKQKVEKHPDMKIDDIKANVSNISSESHSFDLMHIFVSIVNGDGEFEETETEIRFVLRDILSNILDKLEDQSLSTKNETRNETNQMLNKITIPSTMTSVDPAYRLLRMTMISTDESNRIFCLSKLLKSVKDLQAQTALVKLVKETFLNQEKDCLSKAISDAFEAPHDHKALLKIC